MQYSYSSLYAPPRVLGKNCDRTGLKVGQNCARIVQKMYYKCTTKSPFSPNAAQIEGLKKI
jgi:hypothetical protein